MTSFALINVGLIDKSCQSASLGAPIIVWPNFLALFGRNNWFITRVKWFFGVDIHHHMLSYVVFARWLINNVVLALKSFFIYRPIALIFLLRYRSRRKMTFAIHTGKNHITRVMWFLHQRVQLVPLGGAEVWNSGSSSGQTGSGRGLKFRMSSSLGHPNLTLQFNLNPVKFCLIRGIEIWNLPFLC